MIYILYNLILQIILVLRLSSQYHPFLDLAASQRTWNPENKTYSTEIKTTCQSIKNGGHALLMGAMLTIRCNSREIEIV